MNKLELDNEEFDNEEFRHYKRTILSKIFILIFSLFVLLYVIFFYLH